MTTLDVALSYAARGWRVIPVTPGKKHPPFDEWQNIATVDPGQVNAWWGAQYATYGISIVQGALSRIFVIDVDVSDGKRGDDTLRYLIEDNGGDWPDTVHAITGSGGVHYYFRYPTDGQDIHNSAGKLGPGIDVRAEGGHVVAPPSIHPRTGVAYCWEEGFGPSEIEVAEAPKWLLVHLREIEAPARSAPAPTARQPANSDADEGPAQRFNEATTWDQLLTKDSWVLDHTDRDGEQHWVRPGKDPRHGTSATVGHEGRDTLKVFTDGVAFLEQEKAYSRFGYLACRDFGGDRSACAKWLRAQEDERQRAEDRAFMAPYPRVGARPAPGHSTASCDGVLESSNGNGNGNGKLPHRRTKVTWASEVELKPVEWLWGERIPQGALCLLAGREGIGKSTAVYDLAASVTRGALPGDLLGQPRRVLAVVTEDALDRTVVPRLKAAGADLSMVGFITIITDDEVETQLDLPPDLWAFEDEIRDKNPALVILDPLMSRINSKLDTHKDSEVRQALEPIVKIAENTGAAIVGLIHVNKSGGTDPTNMVMGSRAFTAVARSVLFCAVNPENESQRMLGLAKSNLGRLDVGTIRFTMETRTLGELQGKPITASKIVWLGEVAQSIQDVLESASQDPEIRDAVAQATEWLAEFLRSHGGTYSSAAIKEKGKQLGHSHSSIDRARSRLHIKYEASGFPKTTYWSMPNGDLRSLASVASSHDATDATDATGDHHSRQQSRQSHRRHTTDANDDVDATGAVASVASVADNPPRAKRLDATEVDDGYTLF